MRSQSLLAIAPWLVLNSVSAAPEKRPSSSPVSSSATCGGTKYVNHGLVAYGTVASNARDKVGDTLGGFGSAATVDPRSFKIDTHGKVTGKLFAVPDRGWNTQGTIDYQGRVHEFELSFSPTFGSLEKGSENLSLDIKKTTLLSKGKTATTGLDAAEIIKAADSFPDLPAAKRPNGEIAPTLDLEGLVRLRDGSFWASDEYGPYVYHFSADGQMLAAIDPPPAFLPYTDGQKVFLSGNPPAGSDEKEADDPDSGRVNNHGFEGLAISPDERYLTAQLQSATVEDGGTHGTRANKTRQVTWDLFAWPKPRLVSEFVVDLPARNDPTEDKNPRASDSSDIHWLAQHQFLVLSRDSGHGRGADNTTSQWRHIDIVDTKRATNMAEQTVGATAVAPNGYLLPGINTAEYCEFIDINNSTELARFGLHNGGDGDFATELNEKWESIAIIPVPWGAPGHGAHEYYVVSVSDNDFITQDGYYDFGKTKYADESGTSVDTQVLVWQVNLPQYSWY